MHAYVEKVVAAGSIERCLRRALYRGPDGLAGARGKTRQANQRTRRSRGCSAQDKVFIKAAAAALYHEVIGTIKRCRNIERRPGRVELREHRRPGYAAGKRYGGDRAVRSFQRNSFAAAGKRYRIGQGVG